MPTKPQGDVTLIVACEIQPPRGGSFDNAVAAAQTHAIQMTRLREDAARIRVKVECGRPRSASAELEINADTVPAIVDAASRTMPVFGSNGAPRYNPATGQQQTTPNRAALEQAVATARAEFYQYYQQSGILSALSHDTGGGMVGVTVTQPRRPQGR